MAAVDGWSNDVFGEGGDGASPLRADLTGLLDAVDLPILVVGPDSVVAGFNRAAAAALGMAPSHIGQVLGDTGVFSDATELEELCARVIADGTPCRYELRQGGGWFILRIAPYPMLRQGITGAVLTLTNVTAFRASIDQAVYDREYTKAILNAVMEPLVVLDESLKLQTANRAFYAMFHVSREEAQGVPLHELRDHAWEAPWLWTRLKETLAGAKEFQPCEVEHAFPALGRRTLLLDARRLGREGRSSQLLLLAFQDITERKRAEQVLREADRRKDEFLATLSHELRGPLAPLRNMLEIMKHAGGNSELLLQARASMDRQLSHMTRLIDDLLDLSRISRGRIELQRRRVELSVVLYQAIETCQPLADDARHELSITLPPEPIFLDGDPVRLAQVFGNILNNACKYTEPRGKVWVTAERHGGEVLVSVKDTGVGIPPDKIGGIFEMFTQVDPSLERSRGGLGIGLTLVKQIVVLHHGTVTAHSEGKGRGSEFVVRLPVLLEKPKAEHPREPIAEKRTSGHRILVVDDNHDSAMSLATLLKLTGNETRTAHDGLEAVEQAQAYQPGVILLDIGLPKMNGYDACRAIRKQPSGRDIVIVALTGWGQEEDRLRAAQAGFDGHLVKPVDLDALRALLASFGGRDSPPRKATAGSSAAPGR